MQTPSHWHPAADGLYSYLIFLSFFQVRLVFGKTPAMMKWLTKKVGHAFPFPKYYQIIVPKIGTTPCPSPSFLAPSVSLQLTATLRVCHSNVDRRRYGKHQLGDVGRRLHARQEPCRGVGLRRGQHKYP
jgi:hypothetical protein